MSSSFKSIIKSKSAGWSQLSDQRRRGLERAKVQLPRSVSFAIVHVRVRSRNKCIVICESNVTMNHQMFQKRTTFSVPAVGDLSAKSLHPFWEIDRCVAPSLILRLT